MIYELMQKAPPLKWPESEHGIRAIRLRDGSEVKIPVLPETNTLIVGTPGYGKTVLTKLLVSSVLEEDPDTYAVFFQLKPDDFTAQFLRPQDKVISFSPGVCPEENLFKWNMIKEVRLCDRKDWDSVLRKISSEFFDELLQDKRNIAWSGGARDFFEGFLKTILYCYSNNPSNAKVISAMRRMSHMELMKHLAQYPPNRSMLKDNFDFDPPISTKPGGGIEFDADYCAKYKMPRKGSDILFFVQNVLSKYGGTFMSEDGDDTIYEYLHGRYGERLFVLHDHKMRDSAVPFERFFLKYIGDDKISITSLHKGKRMLWVLDEIDKIGADFGLLTAITTGREYKLQVLVSTQSTESLYAIAPDLHAEHLTNASMSGFSVQVAFHPGDAHTIQTMQTLWGKTMKQTVVMPINRYDKPNVINELRPIVEDQDFASLDIGECYIKIRAAEPERVKIIKE